MSGSVSTCSVRKSALIVEKPVPKQEDGSVDPSVGGACAQVRFESDQPGKEGYYEQLEEIRVRLPDDPNQQYDIFLHIYVATPLGDRRLGFKQFNARGLREDEGWSATPQVRIRAS